jgi:predicted  nucleic acid-binding Zn-ribbon protein
MDNASAQIEQLRQEVASLRDQLAHADAKILKCETEIAALEEISKSEIVKMWKRVLHMDKVVVEIQQFIWPVVDKVFPNLLKNYVDVGERFRAPGTDPEIKRD